MRTFIQNSFFGYKLVCDSCKKEQHGQAYNMMNPASKSVFNLTRLQIHLIQFWNQTNVKKEEKVLDKDIENT
jgi:hypothetical protein